MSNNKINLENIFPFLTCFKELKSFYVLKSDIIAWLTVWFVIIPQSMAYASLAWLPIHVWLYTWLVAAIIAGLFGATKQMSTWPITIVSLMTATALFTVVWDDKENYVIYASILAIFTWIFYILLWNLKLWVIVDFLSNPLIIWFTNAAAIITITSQAWKLFWVSYDKWWNYFEWLYNLVISVFSNTHYPTLIFWVLSILFLILLKKTFPKLPRVLFLIIISTSISYFIWFNEIFDWKIVREIPNSLPWFSIPFLNDAIYNNLSFQKILDLIIYSIIIWIIWFTQTISVSKYISTKSKEKTDANKELIWQWITNIFTWLFSWYTVAWSLSKTAVNLRAWAKTWFASIVTWVFICIVLLYLTPYLYNMPMVILASVILVAVVDLIKIKPIINAYKAEKHDWIVWIFTFVVTLIFARELHIWILSWVIFSLGLFISRSMRPRIAEVSMYKDWLFRDVELFWLKSSKNVSVIRFDWVLYFANAWYFEDELLKLISEKSKIKYVIIDLEWLTDIDSTWIETIVSMEKRLYETWIKLLFTWLKVKIITKFKDFWVFDEIWKKHIFVHLEWALDYIYEKKWDDVDLEPLEEYQPKKNWKEELWRYLVKKYISK